MDIAYSPCPNDTFIFHAWAHGLIDAPKLNVTYADIDITNNWAADLQGPEVMKISYAALPWVLDHYRLIPCGGALGRGCGPLVLTREEIAGKRGGARLTGKTVAVPSERSTAYLLFRLWAEQQVPGGVGNIIVMPFHEIMPAVKNGLVDAGLVIHEARFTYQEYGLHMLADMGSWWEEDTGLPIPLGAIIARRNVDAESLGKWIRESLDYAWSHPEASRGYVMEHAQELSPQVAKSHIDLYVSAFSRDLGEKGFGAVEALLGRAAEHKLVPAFDLALLRN
ncbi:1,4-dihydroxy-6-naphthoate synthase [Paenibacillus oryzae]|uniref:1,4-dihydroxy-6-naphtoate synthase n=1 Tax=Paenibacillus oryzae TaxID=1844972 RepID=A0A1A5YQM3_9BACL|nr:1,4-dihydroxy-6-naphthoate synthase [Paenibacillus oryzae]OBR67864.1 1,4-dihydroxy-6-naphthoate synthase [Paenibacillus oryzae]